MLARTAHLAAGIGVTSGVSRASDFLHYADFVVPTADAVRLLVRGEVEAFCALSNACIAQEREANADPSPCANADANADAGSSGCGSGGGAAANAHGLFASPSPTAAARQLSASPTKNARSTSAFTRSRPGVFPASTTARRK
jgi:hypothetical protein